MHSAGDSVGGLMVLGLISFIPRQTIGSQVLRRESCERGGSFALIESDSYDQDAIILQPVRLRHRELGWAAARDLGSW